MLIKLLLNRAAAEAYKLIAQSHRWQKTAIAAAAAAFFGLSSVEAWSLSLGRITVQSALGEPLRAEIDVSEITAEEASSLSTSVGRPEAFSKAGLEFNAIMASLEITLQRRTDGRAYLRLSSDRPVNDPFVDMIIEASWSSGRILRDYTLLFDPPTLRKPATASPTLPQISAAATPRSAAATAAAPPPSASATASAAPARPVVAPTPPDGVKRVIVKEGDTASKIANAVRPAGVSLDQMLVALLRANPDAFIHNNINRIRSGAVLNVPGTENANAQSQQQAPGANQVLVAKSKDFGAFRRSLAANAPLAEVGSATRKASGSIDARVEDKKTPTAPPDKLTLSKGAIQGTTNDDKIAKERVEKESAARAAEISKNISDLKKVAAASAPASEAIKPGSAPAIPAIPVAPVAPAAPVSLPAPAMPVASVPASAPVTEPASAPVSVPASVPSAPEAAASTVVNTPVPARVEIEPSGLMDELLDNPWLPMGAGGLLAVLVGLVFWGVRRRKKKASAHDSSYLESRLQPESFFGTSGGQQIDTSNENPATGGSSMVFLASQMDGGADDVDPVAEADVYLAYGRDVQAEEILKEAVRTNPGRLAVHTKLLEIYYKRRDAQSFETSAEQAYRLTGGAGVDWNRVCDMGLVLDPNNPLYQPGGKPGDTQASSSTMGGASSFNSTIAMPAIAREGPPAAPAGASNLDLDLDFSIDDEPVSVSGDLRANPVAPAASPQPTQTVAIPAAQQDDAHSMDLDFDISGAVPLAPALEEAPKQAPAPDAAGGLDFSTDDLPSLDMPPAPSTPPAAAPAAAEGMLEFDLGSLSLDLDTPPQDATAEQAADADGEDPLATKLALAEEFISIGDEDGARALVEEVVAEASGEMRVKAQGILARLR
ncbi:MAG: fimbrial protein FimV [Rhodoferax sp.]|nr:fimbrial protein FimV [Rhodoferax sp.]